MFDVRVSFLLLPACPLHPDDRLDQQGAQHKGQDATQDSGDEIEAGIAPFAGPEKLHQLIDRGRQGGKSATHACGQEQTRIRRQPVGLNGQLHDHADQ